FAKPLCDCNRSTVRRRDQTDDVRNRQIIESEVESRSRRLRCVASAPELAPQRPADLETRPAFRLMTTDSSNHLGAGFLDGRPHPVSAKMPLTTHDCHAPPRALPAHRLAAEVRHDPR